MDLISIGVVVAIMIAVVWLLDRREKKAKRKAARDLPLKQAGYKADDWFDDAKSYHPPRPGPGGMGGL